MVRKISFSLCMISGFWLLLLAPAGSRAQPYLFNGSQWTNVKQYIMSAPVWYYTYTHYFANGDSLINGNTYKKIYGSVKNCGTMPWQAGQPASCSVPPSPPSLSVLVREVGQRWYIRTPGGQDSLLYRFDLVKGDSVPIAYPPYYLKIDSVFINYANSGRKLFHVKNPDGTISWNGQGYLEGVGPTTGFLSLPDFFPFEQFEDLICYRASQAETICPWFSWLALDEVNADDQLGILYPNPASTSLSIKLPGHFGTAHLRIRDALGRLVLEQTQVGNEQRIYIGALQKGVYLAEVGDGTHLARYKFVKE